MVDKNFDRILEEKLDRIKVEYDPESWQLLEQRLDTELAGTPEGTESDLDEAVFDKLHHLRVPYDPNHWQLMSNRLAQEFTLARQILRYKALELGLVALLLLTIVQYLPLQKTTSGQPWKLDAEELQMLPTPAQQDQGIPSNPSVPQANRPIAGATSSSGTQKQDLSPNTTSSIPNQLITESTRIEENTQRDLSLEESAQKVVRAPFLVPTLKNNIDLTQTIQREYDQRSALALESSPDVSESKSLPTKTSVPENSFEIPREAFLTATLDPVYPGLLSYNEETQEPILDFQPPRRKTFFRVGMFGGADYNKVITPADPRIGLEKLARYTAGYSGGVTFGLEFGRWETETGLIYTAKQYQALPILFFQGSFKDGYLGRGVKDIEINGINVPLNLRYNFLRNEKWRMYVLGGASIQVAVQANYYTANQEGFRSTSFAPAPAPTSSAGRNYNSFKTLADNLPGGWFEGGSFKENGYLTGNIGLGIERYFSGQWSVFMQPTYQHAFNYFLHGLGPTEDEINTFSLYTGIRLRLKK